MLTVEKLEIYQRFRGDVDGWARAVKVDGNPSGMTDADWFLIDELRQGLSLVASGKASATFRSTIEAKLVESTADEETRELLRRLSRESGSAGG